MKRRSFIQNTAATLLATCLPGRLLALTSATCWHDYAHPDLLQIIDNEREVVGIGMSYRRLHPGLDTPESLAAEIRASASHPIAEQVRADFGEGKTIQLNGWILSLTEARQCALYSFLYS
jgi:hypothetical protein